MKETDNSGFLEFLGKFSNSNTECVNAVSNAVNIFLENKDNVNDIKEKIIECDFSVLYCNNT